MGDQICCGSINQLSKVPVRTQIHKEVRRWAMEGSRAQLVLSSRDSISEDKLHSFP